MEGLMFAIKQANIDSAGQLINLHFYFSLFNDFSIFIKLSYAKKYSYQSYSRCSLMLRGLQKY